MKRPIKFRITKPNGEVEYTGLVRGVDGEIAQMTGVDKDGREVYEGDRVISPAGYEYTASLHPFPMLDDYILKENQHEISQG